MTRQERAEVLHKLFLAGVDSVSGVQATKRALAKENFTKPVHLVAVGKAAASMAEGAISQLGSSLISGLVITKHNHLGSPVSNHPLLECIESGHPVPDEHSLLAGRRLCEFVAGIPAQHQLLFLVSGGTSALVEHLQDGLDLQTLKQETDQLLASGAPIGQMNQHRRTLSQIKGGKLAKHVNCSVLQLLISDVPGDEPGDIGSGLLVPDESTGMHAAMPVWQRIVSRIIASSDIARHAVAKAANDMGLDVRQENGSLHGDIRVISQNLSKLITASGQAAGVYIWGGEPTVVLPDSPGRGGRNQHLALSLTHAVAQHGKASLIVCGTDGSDGPTDDAGGLVDEATLDEATRLGLDIDWSLNRADSGTTLEKLNALVTTGPTGTNVMDLAIALLIDA